MKYIWKKAGIGCISLMLLASVSACSGIGNESEIAESIWNTIQEIVRPVMTDPIMSTDLAETETTVCNSMDYVSEEIPETDEEIVFETEILLTEDSTEISSEEKAFHMGREQFDYFEGEGCYKSITFSMDGAAAVEESMTECDNLPVITDLSEAGDGTVLAFSASSNPSAAVITTSEAGRKVIAPANCSRLFQTNIEEVDFSGFDTSEVTDMSYMFENDKQLVRLDLSGFDTSNVKTMKGMFFVCMSLRELNISGFDTSQVTDMSLMFMGGFSLETLDVSGFDTANVTNMGSMFLDCRLLTTLDVSGFDTSKVERMQGMFWNCGSLTYLDVSGFDTSKVHSMASMFNGCSSLTELDVSRFDTSRNENANCMFNNCSSLTTLDVSGFDMSNAINMEYMFGNCVNLNEYPDWYQN